MKIDLHDFWALTVTFIQAGLILYALRSIPRIGCRLRCGWSYLVAMMTFMFLNRVIFTLDCFAESDFWPIQHVLMALSSFCFFMFVYRITNYIRNEKNGDIQRL